jgi:hypothetical protein
MNAFTADAARLRPISVSTSRRERVERVVELLLAALDLIDGDPDIEDGDVDTCEVAEDQGSAWRGFGYSWLPGDPDDAEDDDPAEEDNEDCGKDGS